MLKHVKITRQKKNKGEKKNETKAKNGYLCKGVRFTEVMEPCGLITAEWVDGLSTHKVIYFSHPTVNTCIKTLHSDTSTTHSEQVHQFYKKNLLDEWTKKKKV